ncbi:MAG: hypothetical protein M3068_02595 [Gemmatimonadota bacterium]|nr:hypothetical protein [Gemmatimonadota bacterium]
MSGATTPALSVVLPAPAGYGAIAAIIRHLRAQTALERTELVLVVPPGTSTDWQGESTAGFARVRVIEQSGRMSALRAAGIRAAGAPIVVSAEDHSFPAPDWAEAIITAHQGPWAAVGPQFENANPGRMTSWADLILSFGDFVGPVTRGVTNALPWHNTSYKRDLIMQYGPRLEELLDTEGLLLDDLRARGYQLWLEPQARTAHVNFNLVRPLIVEHFISGRLFGANRATQERWSRLRRAVYLVAGILIPVARAPRLWKQVRRVNGRHRLLPGVLPPLVLGLLAHTAGELVGYGAGVGDAARQKSELEFDRGRYVSEEQLVVFAS